MYAKLTAEEIYKKFREARKKCPDLAPGQESIWAIKGSFGKYTFICKKHGNYKRNWNSRTVGNGCSACWDPPQTTEQMYLIYPDLKPGQVCIKAYKSKFIFICKKCGEYEARLREHACPCCKHLSSPTPFPKELEASLRALGITPNFNFLKVSIIYAPNT